MQSLKFDKLANAFGNQADSRIYNQREMPIAILDQSRSEYSGLFRFAWALNRALKIRAQDMTFSGWRYDHPEASPEALTELNRRINSQNIRTGAEEAILEDSLYGGALLIPGVVDSSIDQSEPLNLDAIQTIEGYRVVDRYYATPNHDRLNYSLRTPTSYFVSNTTEIVQAAISGRGLEVHASRVLRFEGEHVSHYERIANLGWGDSLLNTLYDPWRQFQEVTNLSLTAIERLNIIVHNINNLSELIAQGNREEIKAHLQDVHEQLLLFNTLIVDGSIEGLNSRHQSISGLDKILEKFEDNITAAIGIPWSRFWGKSGRGGLQEGGSSEMQNWHQTVHHLQNKKLKMPLEQYTQMHIHAQDFPYTEEFTTPGEITFNPIQEPNAKNEAEVAEIRAKTYTIYEMANLTPDQISLIEDGDSAGAMELRPEPTEEELRMLPTNQNQAQQGTNEPGADNSEGKETEDQNVTPNRYFEREALITANDVRDAIEAGKRVLPEEFDLIFEAN